MVCHPSRPLGSAAARPGGRGSPPGRQASLGAGVAVAGRSGKHGAASATLRRPPSATAVPEFSAAGWALSPPAVPFPGPAGRAGPFGVAAPAPPPFLLPPAGAEVDAGPRFPPGSPYFQAAPPFPPRPLSEEEAVAAQRQQDELWLSQFLGRRRSALPPPPPPVAANPSSARELAVEALGRVARLAALCRTLRQREAEGDESGWAQAQEEAEVARRELQEVVRPLREPGYRETLRRKAERARKRRLRLQRRKREAKAAKEEEAARAAEREAKIDQWRAKCIQEVEEKNREQELKAAADSVLSEVRKKQADTKRMVDILHALEKLRKLRKEAAARKGVFPPPSADEAFETQVESLKTLLKNRTELYEAEERALRVMLEGEQEEERKREMEKKQKKEREKLLQQKLEIDSKLFGDPAEFPLAHLLQPFRDYYLQAEHSVAALIQIRHEWDQYLVPADHPEGSCIPPGWVLPSLPTNDTWATAVR